MVADTSQSIKTSLLSLLKSDGLKLDAENLNIITTKQEGKYYTVHYEIKEQKGRVNAGIRSIPIPTTADITNIGEDDPTITQELLDTGSWDGDISEDYGDIGYDGELSEEFLQDRRPVVVQVQPRRVNREKYSSLPEGSDLEMAVTSGMKEGRLAEERSFVSDLDYGPDEEIPAIISTNSSADEDSEYHSRPRASISEIVVAAVEGDHSEDGGNRFVDSQHNLADSENEKTDDGRSNDDDAIELESLAATEGIRVLDSITNKEYKRHANEIQEKILRSTTSKLRIIASRESRSDNDYNPKFDVELSETGFYDGQIRYSIVNFSVADNSFEGTLKLEYHEPIEERESYDDVTDVERSFHRLEANVKYQFTKKVLLGFSSKEETADEIRIIEPDADTSCQEFGYKVENEISTFLANSYKTALEKGFK